MRKIFKIEDWKHHKENTPQFKICAWNSNRTAIQITQRLKDNEVFMADFLYGAGNDYGYSLVFHEDLINITVTVVRNADGKIKHIHTTVCEMNSLQLIEDFLKMEEPSLL